MDFTLSKEHEMARTVVPTISPKQEVKPLAQEVDETETFPRGTVEKMAEAWLPWYSGSEGVRRTGL